MKKLTTTIAAILLISCFIATSASAATTTLTTAVPGGDYTLVIPDNQEIPFGTTSRNIGSVKVSNATGFAIGKNLNVAVNYGPLASSTVETTIPYNLYSYYARSTSSYNTMSNAKLENNGVLTFTGKSDGTVRSHYNDSNSNYSGEYLWYDLTFNASSSDWGAALPGDYSSTITFTAEVVRE